MVCPPLSKDEYYPVFLVAPAPGQIMAREGKGSGGGASGGVGLGVLVFYLVF